MGTCRPPCCKNSDCNTLHSNIRRQYTSRSNNQIKIDVDATSESDYGELKLIQSVCNDSEVELMKEKREINNWIDVATVFCLNPDESSFIHNGEVVHKDFCSTQLNSICNVDTISLNSIHSTASSLCIK
eukprot:257811_1